MGFVLCKSLLSFRTRIAQLSDCESNASGMSFVVECDSKKIHVLNVISLAWICAIPVARHVVDYCRGVWWRTRVLPDPFSLAYLRAKLRIGRLLRERSA